MTETADCGECGACQERRPWQAHEEEAGGMAGTHAVRYRSLDDATRARPAPGHRMRRSGTPAEPSGTS